MLSRASAKTSAIADGSSVPAYAKPVRPSLIMRIPTPSLWAETKCSSSPSYTRTEVSPPRETYASICSPGFACSTTESASFCKSGTPTVMLPCRRLLASEHEELADHHQLAHLDHLCHRFQDCPSRSRCPADQCLSKLLGRFQSSCLRATVR